MNSFNIYIVVLILLIIAAFTTSVFLLSFNSDNIEKREKIPRNILLGIIVVVGDLIWCIPHSRPIVPEMMQSWLIPMAVIGSWLCYQFLDYLFSRALGGFLILFSHYLLYSSFTYHAPLKPFFSLLCYIFGTFGIFLCAKPHLLRDLFRKIAVDKRWKYSVAALLVVDGIAALIITVVTLTK